MRWFGAKCRARSINPTWGRVTFSLRDHLPFEDLSFRSAEGAAMSQSSSGAPGWQLEGNAPLAYDTHIVDVFLQDYSRRLAEVAAIKPGDRVLDVACGTGV